MAKSKRKPAARVLIVDDHPAVREALAIRIAAQPDLEVCGEAADEVEALRLAVETDPDVDDGDVGLKGGDGIDLIKRLRARNDRFRAIIWSMYGEDLYAERALRAGAVGYLNKEHATSEIVAAIRQALDGKVYLSPAMSEKLLRRVVGSAGPDYGRAPVETLSDRELEVLRRIGNGVRTAEIAVQLHLSVKTVETYRDRIRQKLGLTDGADLARYAAQWVLEEGRVGGEGR
ncbi:MAG: response regulator transcription factor [Isosphaeraceae bacterium]|nr:response regulator transcription factor [Isosphaeraceae bacterium]